MIRAQIYFVGKLKIRRRNSKLVGLRRFLENLVAARVFHLKSQLTVGGRRIVRPIERQRAHVNCLARLVDGLFGGEKNGNLVFEAHCLREFR